MGHLRKETDLLEKYELLQSTGVRDDDDNDVFYLEVGASCDENMRRGSFEERDRSIGEI